ncbi:RagB/SusD family nutrient uptake outer membrane protein [Chitinophaga rhizosphaerae]|uniref:RagB/SusD family nutrient uptake outer membrane protein n=1 Tax=Chitinophaga rhizosphaerae TaxID=1864947 RepID=UPI000F80F0F5|nr:RagB/SusD family nutrient uptake outer membrane protein [Chitinophaga rhizosphaerae]
MTIKSWSTIYISVAALALGACNKDFLQRAPQTEVTPEYFFKTAGDLETYSNTFYPQFNDYYGYDGFGYEDVNSDNVATFSNSSELQSMLNGTLSPATVAANTWDANNWGTLRNINYMLENYSGAVGDPVAIRHYVGIARFFRARYYFAKLRRFSDVPWVSHTLAHEAEELYKPADPRALVADSILNDLQFAVDNMKSISGDGTRVSKEAALVLMSRYCLYEGTFRKYHPELGLQGDHTRFLEKAEWAAAQLMSGNKFTLTQGGAEGFRAMFGSGSLTGNKEMILWRAANKEQGIANNSGNTVYNYLWALSRSLQETFLMKDGSRFTDQPGYAQKTLLEVFVDRDPRMAETIAPPGFAELPNPALGGYNQVKFYPREAALRGGWLLTYTALPIYRYAEVLLNYIEARAELGTATQADVDNTINKIRARVGMPGIDLAAANANVDPVLAAYYPNVTGTNQGLILEVRRERRVELACEGFRYDDLQRWYAGKRLADAQQGIYVPAIGAMDMTGDGTLDLAILPSPKDTLSIKDLPADVRKKLARFYLKNSDGTLSKFYLTEGTSGYIAFWGDKTKGPFLEPKFYYRPIPQQQTVLNPKLKQPFGW